MTEPPKDTRPWVVKQDQFIYDADERMVARVCDLGFTLRPRTDQEVKEIAGQIVAACNAARVN